MTIVAIAKMIIEGCVAVVDVIFWTLVLVVLINIVYSSMFETTGGGSSHGGQTGSYGSVDGDRWYRDDDGVTHWHDFEDV
jgi:hypothetical protein